MLFDLTPLDEGEWFPFFTSRINEKGDVEYDEPKASANRVRIRPLEPFFEKRRAGRKRKFEFVLNPQTRLMDRVGYYPDQSPEELKQEREDTWDYCITGVVDAAGNTLPFSKEDKIAHMDHPVFNRFVARCLQLLASARVTAQEESVKN
jgi:hypothetical protein